MQGSSNNLSFLPYLTKGYLLLQLGAANGSHSVSYSIMLTNDHSVKLTKGYWIHSDSYSIKLHFS
jgi:hypothetical protein